MSSTKNIAKNSLFLYLRMFLNMGVGLFTAGIVLNTLGITDYGIYNIVGGFVSMFGFLNSSMSSATQRFLSFDIGRNDSVQLRKTFSTTVSIHFVIAIIVVLALETFGLWYINNKLNVPQDRMDAVNIVFQFSVLSTFFGIIQVPYNALITAREKFDVYTIISFLEIGLKLLILFLIVHADYDKLILYAILLFCSSFFIRMIYRVYCRREFPESKYKFYFDKSYFHTLLAFSGWNLFGTIAVTARGQGNNLVLNWFFGAAMNAAYGITSQVQSLVSSFVSNFQIAVNPQIVKNYAAGNKAKSMQLIVQSAKFSFGLMILIILPIYTSLQFVLDVWLKNYPQQSILFIKLTFVIILIDTISNPLMTGLQATGKIRMYQIVVGTLVFLNLPISYLLIRNTARPEMIFLTSIIISSIALWFRLYYLKTHMGIGITLFIKEVLMRILFLIPFVFLIYYLSNYIQLSKQWVNFLVKSGIIVVLMGLVCYACLFNKREKLRINQFIKSRWLKFFN